jgi:hypothetical protein
MTGVWCRWPRQMNQIHWKDPARTWTWCHV